METSPPPLGCNLSNPGKSLVCLWTALETSWTSSNIPPDKQGRIKIRKHHCPTDSDFHCWGLEGGWVGGKGVSGKSQSAAEASPVSWHQHPHQHHQQRRSQWWIQHKKISRDIFDRNSLAPSKQPKAVYQSLTRGGEFEEKYSQVRFSRRKRGFSEINSQVTFSQTHCCFQCSTETHSGKIDTGYSEEKFDYCNFQDKFAIGAPQPQQENHRIQDWKEPIRNKGYLIQEILQPFRLPPILQAPNRDWPRARHEWDGGGEYFIQRVHFQRKD